MKTKNRILLALLALALILSATVPAAAVTNSELQGAMERSAQYMIKAVPAPQPGSIGGEWAVLGLARSGVTAPDGYFETYYAQVENYVRACNGVLHEKKYTEYSRTVLALTAIGKDPSNIAGYNLLSPLGDFERTVWQGINGPIWALIALDSGSYEIPRNESATTQATRQMYIDEILSRQLTDGGFALSGSTADPDLTAMALQALAKYQDQRQVKAAIDRALICLSERQDGNGGYASWNAANSESVAQVLIALCELGIDLNDARFIKNGRTLLDNLFTYRQSDGSFVHMSDGGSGSNQMASEQGLCSLAAAWRATTGKNSLYRMSDAIGIGPGTDLPKGQGLPGKDPSVKPMPVTAPGTTFSDILVSTNKTAIESLAERGIINGMGDGTFRPEKTMTRAEFCAIITRGLGLTPQDTRVFTDVPSDRWYAGYIGTANRYGIVKGVGDNRFAPESSITRQEAATMVARAARLCGMNTSMGSYEIQNVLARLSDHASIADWAQESVAFCYDRGIMERSDLYAEPRRAILRREIAQMLFNLLDVANLI